MDEGRGGERIMYAALRHIQDRREKRKQNENMKKNVTCAPVIKSRGGKKTGRNKSDVNYKNKVPQKLSSIYSYTVHTLG